MTIRRKISVIFILSRSWEIFPLCWNDLYINNSLHLARKYAQIFVRGHYLFREANSFPRAKLEENCELRGTDNVQGKISEHIFKAKWRLLWLLSFKYFSQHVATSLSIWTFRLRTVYRQKRLERMLFSDTALSTSRFISSSVAKANCSPHLDINFNCKQDARLEVFEIGEYHLENIDGYSPVLAAVYSVTWGV